MHAGKSIGRWATLLGLVLATVVSLTACAATAVEDTPPTWELRAQGDIVALDSKADVYLSGRMFYGSGSITSQGVIDYEYVQKLKDGGIRQDLISSTYERFGGKYPGSEAVTLYQDAQPDGRDARIQIYRCSTGWTGCTMPSGSKRQRLRIDIHVPPHAVVQQWSEQDAPKSGATRAPGTRP